MSKPEPSEPHVEYAACSRGGARTHEPPPFKEPLAPNAGKQLDVEVDGQTWARVPLQTELFARGDDLEARVDRVRDRRCRRRRPSTNSPRARANAGMCRQREDRRDQPGPLLLHLGDQSQQVGKVLSRFVVRTPHGLGLGTPWTMQLAIEEAGLPRIVAPRVPGRSASSFAEGLVLPRRGSPGERDRRSHRVLGLSVQRVREAAPQRSGEGRDLVP